MIFSVFTRLSLMACKKPGSLLAYKVQSNNSFLRQLLHSTQRQASTEPKQFKQSEGLIESDGKKFKDLSFPDKVKQTGKDVSYTAVIVAGVGITGMMFYFIGRELFSGDSVNGVYTRAVKRCTKDSEVLAALGEPVKGYGETTRRGRRRYPSHMEYEHDGAQFLRMKFYLEGSKRKATAQLEMKKNESKHFDYRYLFVELDGYPRQTVVLEDNR